MQDRTATTPSTMLLPATAANSTMACAIVEVVADTRPAERRDPINAPSQLPQHGAKMQIRSDVDGS